MLNQCFQENVKDSMGITAKYILDSQIEHSYRECFKNIKIPWNYGYYGGCT